MDDTNHIKYLLDKCQKMDVHCHPDYLTLFQNYTGHKAIYLYYGNDDNYIIAPYFERPIKLAGNKSNSEYIDLVSPWYYGGLIHNIKEQELLQKTFYIFIKKFNEYCKKNNVVTEFQRFNPILKNNAPYRDQTSLFYDRKIVYIDLTKDLELIYEEYTRHTRKNINKALRSNLKVYHNENKEHISKFIEIYSESMKRINTKKFYYFNEAFFNELFKKFKDDVKLFHVEYDDKIICSSIELGKYGILHDYLRGIIPEYLSFRPNDILIVELIRWAKNAGYKYFILGGGNSSSEEDGLFRFKKSFSSTTAEFYVYKKIHDMNVYKKNCEINGIKHSDLKYEKARFFPEYL